MQHKPIDHLEHARALARNAQFTDDPEMGVIYAALAQAHAAVAQAEQTKRIGGILLSTWILIAAMLLAGVLA